MLAGHQQWRHRSSRVKGVFGRPLRVELLVRLGCNLNPRSSEREGETERHRARKRHGRRGREAMERERECNVSWDQKVNRGPDCSMLSVGRGPQLGQAHGGTRATPWTSTFISGKEGWLLSLPLFIFISLPLGAAWPYGKSSSPYSDFTFHCTCLLSSSCPCVSTQLLGSLFSRSRHQHSSCPLLLSVVFKEQRLVAKLVKEESRTQRDAQIFFFL